MFPTVKSLLFVCSDFKVSQYHVKTTGLFRCLKNDTNIYLFHVKSRADGERMVFDCNRILQFP